MRVAAVVTGLTLVTTALTGPPAAATGATSPEVEVTHEVVRSFDGEPIYTTLFLPAGTGPADPAPLVMRSHGWSGHGERTLAEASSTTKALLDAGYAVFTWDERGFGYSGGQVRVLKPEHEGRDVSALLDHVATTPRIASAISCETVRDPDGTCPDPVVGMTGRSYGGGVQLLAAAFDAEFSGTTSGTEPRIDATAPEITWNDLRYSLYSHEVLNLGWSEFLYAVGVPTARGEGLDPANPAGPRTGGLHPQLHRAQAEGAATNSLSQESAEFFGRSSLAEYGDEHPVAVPTLFMQGSVDTLFDLTEAARSFHHVRGRAPAKLVAFCGGHVACPANYADADDRQFLDRQILTWFDRYLRGNEVDTGAPVAYRTNEGVWRTAQDFPPDDARPVVASGRGTVVSSPVPTTARPDTSATGAPLIVAQPNPPGDPHAITTNVAVAGPHGMELVGIPTARVEVSGTGEAVHLFLKLVDRETGQVVNLQEASLEVSELSPVPREFRVRMPGVAYTLPPGHHLDLQVSTTSTMHAPARVPAQADVRVSVRVPVRPSAGR